MSGTTKKAPSKTAAKPRIVNMDTTDDFIENEEEAVEITETPGKETKKDTVPDYEDTALPEGLKLHYADKKKKSDEESIASSLDSSKVLEEFIIADPKNIIVKDMLRSQKALSHNREIILRKSSTKQVIAMQSAYIAHMSAFTMGEIYMIRNNEQDLYADKYSLFQLIYKHIEELSIGTVTFEEFLKNTSYFDLATLLFGIYAQTYTEKNKVPVYCPACKKRTVLELDNEDFITSKDEGIYKEVLEILGSRDYDTAFSKSLVHTKDRIVLKSKIIVDVFTPSLDDYLKVIKSIKEDTIEKNQEIIILLLNIEEIYVPDFVNFQKTGEASFYALGSVEERFKLLFEMAPEDIKVIEEEISQRIQKRNIEYRTPKDIVCNYCKEDPDNAGLANPITLPSIAVDFEELFFRQIYR